MRLIGSKTFTSAVAGFLAVSGMVQAAGTFGIQGAKVVLLSGGVEDATYNLDPPAPLAAIDLNPKSSLKLSFVTIDTSTREAVQPRSAQVLFQDELGQEAVGSVNVKANGKGSYVLNLANPLPFIPTSPISLSLLLSSPTGPAPFQYLIATLNLPQTLITATAQAAQAKKRGGAGSTFPSFEALPEIYPTMPHGETEVPVVISLAGVGIVLAPWVVLLGIYSRLSPSLHLSSPSPTSAVFLLSLLALEVLFATYWAVLKLYHLLPALAVLGLVAAFTGKNALRGLKV